MNLKIRAIINADKDQINENGLFYNKIGCRAMKK